MGSPNYLNSVLMRVVVWAGTPISLISEEYTYAPFNVTTNALSEHYLPVSVKTDAYFLDMTKLTKENWGIAVPYGYFVYDFDASGDRTVAVQILQYDQSGPQETWTDEFGVYIGEITNFMSYQISAAQTRETILQVSRGPQSMSGWDVPEGHKVFLAVVAMQNSPILIDLINFEIHLEFYNYGA